MSYLTKAFLCAAALLAGCAPSGVEIKAAGATFPAELYELWAEVYSEKAPETDITYEAVGSGEGTRRFLAEAVDLGASDAALSDEQVNKVSRGALMIPMTAGSIALAYNPRLPAGLKLSRDVYVDMFLGKISRWNDPRIAEINPGVQLPDLPISIAVRSDGSGTTFAFTNHLSAVSPAWRSGPGVGKTVVWPKADLSAPGNGLVARLVQLTPGAIAYLEYGVAWRAKLGLATLENKAGVFIAPGGDSGLATLSEAELPANLRAFFPDPAGKQAYPIVTFTWMLAYQKYPTPEKAQAVKGFLRWCLTDGQALSEERGFVRLSPQVAQAALAAAETIGP